MRAARLRTQFYPSASPAENTFLAFPVSRLELQQISSMALPIAHYATSLPSKSARVYSGSKANSRALVRVRTAGNDRPASTQEGGTYFYQGKSYTPAEWEAAFTSGQLAEPPSVADEYKRQNRGPSFTELMKFDGVVPERANGRLAMIAVIAAVSAELSSGKGVLSQLKIEPTLITLTFLLISVATFIPFSQNVDPEEKEGIFTPYAELVNGRAAMLGFASLLLIEAVRGTALFGQ